MQKFHFLFTLLILSYCGNLSSQTINGLYENNNRNNEISQGTKNIDKIPAALRNYIIVYNLYSTMLDEMYEKSLESNQRYQTEQNMKFIKKLLLSYTDYIINEKLG